MERHLTNAPAGLLSVCHERVADNWVRTREGEVSLLVSADEAQRRKQCASDGRAARA